MSADSIEKIADDLETIAKQADHGLRYRAGPLLLRTMAQRLRALPSAELERDAARYRWFRDNADANYQNGNVDFWLYYDGIHMQQGEELDQAIDDARASEAQR